MQNICIRFIGMSQTKIDTGLGYLYENMVAQMLYVTGKKLFYHAFPKENSGHNYEVEFFSYEKKQGISYRGEIIRI